MKPYKKIVINNQFSFYKINEISNIFSLNSLSGSSCWNTRQFRKKKDDN